MKAPALEEVLAAAMWAVECYDNATASGPMTASGREALLLAQAACMNLVRANGPALLAMEGDSRRLDWLLENHANVETDGAGNWRAVLEWTNPETYFPYAKDRRAAIDASLGAGKGPDAARAGASE